MRCWEEGNQWHVDKCLTTGTLRGEKSWFIAFANFHTVDTPTMMSLNTELGREVPSDPGSWRQPLATWCWREPPGTETCPLVLRRPLPTPVLWTLQSLPYKDLPYKDCSVDTVSSSCPPKSHLQKSLWVQTTMTFSLKSFIWGRPDGSVV